MPGQSDEAKKAEGRWPVHMGHSNCGLALALGSPPSPCWPGQHQAGFLIWGGGGGGGGRGERCEPGCGGNGAQRKFAGSLKFIK